MTGIVWKHGRPPDTQRGKRLLFIASPTGGNCDANDDNRPDIYVGHFGEAADDYVPAKGSGGCLQTMRGRHWM